jgi:hypothetical protein
MVMLRDTLCFQPGNVIGERTHRESCDEAKVKLRFAPRGEKFRKTRQREVKSKVCVGNESVGRDKTNVTLQRTRREVWQKPDHIGWWNPTSPHTLPPQQQDPATSQRTASPALIATCSTVQMT